MPVVPVSELVPVPVPEPVLEPLPVVPDPVDPDPVDPDPVEPVDPGLTTGAGGLTLTGLSQAAKAKLATKTELSRR